MGNLTRLKREDEERLIREALRRARISNLAVGGGGGIGADGVGVPTGGILGDVLTKDSGTDFDTSWLAPAVTTDYGFRVVASGGAVVFDGTGDVVETVAAIP